MGNPGAQSGPVGKGCWEGLDKGSELALSGFGGCRKWTMALDGTGSLNSLLWEAEGQGEV